MLIIPKGKIRVSLIIASFFFGTQQHVKIKTQSDKLGHRRVKVCLSLPSISWKVSGNLK